MASQSKQQEKKAAEEEKLLTKLSKELASIETKLGKALGYKIFDYAFVLDPFSRSTISVSGLKEENNDLLKKYIDKAHEILKAMKVDLKIQSEDLFDQFIEISHEIYLVRFLEARQLVAEYALVRVPTRTEQELMRKDPLRDIPELDITVSINIPDGFLLNDYGGIDFEATKKSEEKTNQLKSTLSAIGEMIPIKEQMYNDILSISHRAMIIRLNPDLFINFCEYASQLFLVITARMVYRYIDQGYSIMESRENVYDYIKKLTSKAGTKLPKDYEKLAEQLKEELAEILAQTAANKETKEIIINEFLELWVFYLNEGIFVPENFYNIKFRDSTEFNSYEQYYHYLLDVYPYDDYGQLLWTPIEAYDIDFSQETKQTLFEVVTNGIQNPDFTLDDYLRLG